MGGGALCPTRGGFPLSAADEMELISGSVQRRAEAPAAGGGGRKEEGGGEV